MIHLPRTEFGFPGWRPRTVRVGDATRVTASITCPSCRASYTLGETYTVDVDGAVDKAPVCFCGLKDDLTLDGWADLTRPFFEANDIPERDAEPRMVDLG